MNNSPGRTSTLIEQDTLESGRLPPRVTSSSQSQYELLESNSSSFVPTGNIPSVNLDHSFHLTGPVETVTPFLFFHSQDFYIYWFIAPALGALSDPKKNAVQPASSASVDSAVSPQLS